MIACGKCHTPLTGGVINTDPLGFCPNCGVPTIARVFPAYLRPPERVDLEKSFIFEDEAACFHHPTKKAVRPCDACGRFICSLCDVLLDDQHLCPVCIETGRRKRKIVTLEHQRTLYDRVTLSLVFFPLILLWPMILFWPFTAAAAIFVAIRYWKSPPSLVPRRAKLRSVLAVLLALGQMGLWALGLFSIVGIIE